MRQRTINGNGHNALFYLKTLSCPNLSNKLLVIILKLKCGPDYLLDRIAFRSNKIHTFQSLMGTQQNFHTFSIHSLGNKSFDFFSYACKTRIKCGVKVSAGDSVTIVVHSSDILSGTVAFESKLELNMPTGWCIALVCIRLLLLQWFEIFAEKCFVFKLNECVAVYTNAPLSTSLVIQFKTKANKFKTT